MKKSALKKKVHRGSEIEEKVEEVDFVRTSESKRYLSSSISVAFFLF